MTTSTPADPRAVRRLAAKHGLALSKSRRDGTFMILDASTNAVVAGDHNNGYGLTIDAALDWLREWIATPEADIR